MGSGWAFRFLFTATPPACALVALTRFVPAPYGAKTADVGGGTAASMEFLVVILLTLLYNETIYPAKGESCRDTVGSGLERAKGYH